MPKIDQSQNFLNTNNDEKTSISLFDLTLDKLPEIRKPAIRLPVNETQLSDNNQNQPKQIIKSSIQSIQQANNLPEIKKPLEKIPLKILPQVTSMPVINPDVKPTIQTKTNIKVSFPPQITQNIQKPIPLIKNQVQFQKINTFPTEIPKNEQMYIPPLKKQEEVSPVETQEPKKIPIYKSILLILLFGILITVFFYIFLNFPALWSKLTFFYREKTGKIPEVQKIIPQISNNQDLLFLDIVSQYAPKKKLPTKTDLGISFLENNQIFLPKLDVRAPIVWESPVDDPTLMSNLKNGVVHFLGTTKPGEKSADGEGNIFISGHSSYYWWDDGKYNTVFANLENLDPDNEIAIGYDDFAFVYKVIKKEVIDPNNKVDIERVLAQNTKIPTLTLMTCVPVGTDARRLIITSELIAIGTDNLAKAEFFIEETKEPSPSPSPVAPTISPAPVPIISPSTFPNQDSINMLPWIK